MAEALLLPVLLYIIGEIERRIKNVLFLRLFFYVVETYAIHPG